MTYTQTEHQPASLPEIEQHRPDGLTDACLLMLDKYPELISYGPDAAYLHIWPANPTGNEFYLICVESFPHAMTSVPNNTKAIELLKVEPDETDSFTRTITTYNEGEEISYGRRVKRSSYTLAASPGKETKYDGPEKIYNMELRTLIHNLLDGVPFQDLEEHPCDVSEEDARQEWDQFSQAYAPEVNTSTVNSNQSNRQGRVRMFMAKLSRYFRDD